MRRLSAILLTLVLMCCALAVTVSAAELPQLPAPTDLEWDYDHVNDIPLPGTISWKGIGMGSVYYEVEVYRDGERDCGTRIYAEGDTEPIWYTWDGFAKEYCSESGTYSFTVTAYPGGSDSYSRSVDVQSGEWIYVKPEKTLSPCTQLSMDAEHIYWTAPEDTGNLGGYDYIIRYSKFEDMYPLIGTTQKTIYSAEDAAGGTVSWDGPGNVHPSGSAGFYQIWVRMLSNDIRQACHSEWVQMDEPFCYEFQGVGESARPLLGRCSITGVDETRVTWEPPADTTYVGGYEMEIYFSFSPEAKRSQLSYLGRRTGTELDGCSWAPDEFESLEEGYFYFMVRMKTSDGGKAVDSLWSDLSEPFYYRNPSTQYTDNDGNVLPFSAKEWTVVKLVNQERMAAGLKPLTVFDALQAASEIRAEEIKEKFSHTRPDGTKYYTLFNELGISWNNRGENIGMGYDSSKLWGQMHSPEQVMESWMNSKDHRDNILKAAFSHIGVSLGKPCSAGDYWVQNFTDGTGYTSMEVQVKGGYTVEPGTTIEEMDLVAILQSKRHGRCYLPVAAEYCSGYDPDQLGTQTVTISILGVKDTFEITVADAAAAGVKGDIDGDGTVNDADVAHLLWYTLFPEDYPISGNADFNGDGNVDDADVAYLLWYTLFPESYPLT